MKQQNPTKYNKVTTQQPDYTSPNECCINILVIFLRWGTASEVFVGGVAQLAESKALMETPPQSFDKPAPRCQPQLDVLL